MFLEIRPMMAKSADQPFDDPDWIFEMKWDGYRAIAIIDKGNVRLVSRNGLSLNSKFAGIVEALKSLKVESAILDGELVVIDEEGIPPFELVQRIQQKPPGELIYLTDVKEPKAVVGEI